MTAVAAAAAQCTLETRNPLMTLALLRNDLAHHVRTTQQRSPHRHNSESAGVQDPAGYNIGDQDAPLPKTHPFLQFPPSNLRLRSLSSALHVRRARILEARPDQLVIHCCAAPTW